MTAQPKRILDTSTRILAADDRTRYDRVAMTLHWITVLLVLGQFALAQTWDGFARPTRHLMEAAHMSFGIVLAAVVMARIAWRLIPGHQMPPATSGLVELASKAVHWLLYGLLLGEAVLGFVLRWSGAESMIFFGLQLPPPFGPFPRPVHHEIGEIHEWVGWAIIVIAAGHAAAALYHHLVVKDRVLVRMAPIFARRRA